MNIKQLKRFSFAMLVLLIPAAGLVHAAETQLMASKALKRYLIENAKNDAEKSRLDEELTLQDALVSEAKRLKLDQKQSVKAEVTLAQRRALVKAYWAHYFEQHPVKKADIQKIYDDLKAANGEFQYHLRQIVVKDDKAARKAIDALKKKKKTFAQIAGEMSVDDASRQQGGDLGWKWKTDLLPPFRRIVDLLKPSEYTTPPVQISDRLVILKLEESRKQDFPEFGTLRPQLESMLRLSIQQQELARLKK